MVRFICILSIAQTNFVLSLLTDHFKWKAKASQKGQAKQAKKQKIDTSGNCGDGGTNKIDESGTLTSTTVVAGGTRGKGPDEEAGPSDHLTDELLSDFCSSDKALQQISNVFPHFFNRMYPWPPPALTSGHPCTINVQLQRAPLLLAGRWESIPSPFLPLCLSLSLSDSHSPLFQVPEAATRYASITLV